MRKIASLLSVLMLLCTLAFAQTRTITGTVRDENGNAIPFATITETGTKNATTADVGGRFSIALHQNGSLTISATGFQNQLLTPSGNTTDVSLVKSESQLQEVVVTSAYNTKRTARSTSYNAQVVSADQLNVIRQTNLNNALAGKVSGLQVRSQSLAKLGSSPSVRLRGEGGLGLGETVIYVVDGTILPNPDDINMDDVEDITVLQGPAAAALFGSQGGSGAIVITMKKGKRNAKGVGVEVNLGAQFDRVYKLPNYQNSYAGGGITDLMKYTWKTGDPVEWKALDGKYYHDYSDDASWGPRMVGQEYIPWYAWYGGHPYSYKTAKLTPIKDNARDFFNTGVTLNNSVSFTKATENASFRFSYGNVDIKGLLPESYARKNTFNFSSSVDISQHFIAAANVNFITNKVKGEIDDAYSNQSTGSFNQWFHRELDMDIMKELKDLKTPTGVWASWNHANPNTFDAAKPDNFYAGNYWYNFFKWYDLAGSTTNRDKLIGDVSLTYKLNDAFRIRGTYRRQQVNTWFEEMFSSDLLTSGLQAQGNEPKAFGYYGTYQANNVRRNIEFLASYTKKIKDFAVNANLGSDFFSYNYKDVQGNTNQGLNIPNFYSLKNSKDPASLNNRREREKYNAVFARGDVGYKNFLFAEFTIRNDWYSTLPPTNNDILSKSVGASFVFSDLLKNIPWLSYGKLRASWGEIPQALGLTSTSFGAYRYPGFDYEVGQFQWNGNFLMATPNQLVDSSIHGTVKIQKEVGAELRFLKNRIGISGTYWDGSDNDIPRAITINGASGFTSFLVNTGKITKKGIDIQLNGRPIWMKDLKWEVNATYGRTLENKIVKIADGVPQISDLQRTYGATAPTLTHIEGKTWGQIYGTGMLRIKGVPVLDANGLYVKDPTPMSFGSVLPKYTGGLQNSFQFLNDFTLNVNFDYQVGGKFFSLSDMWGSYSGLTARTAAVNDKGFSVRDAVADGGGVHVSGVDKDGKAVDYYVEAQTYFHQQYTNKVFDEFIYDLTFVKLRELSLGYNLPVTKMGIGKWASKATLTLVARNPAMIYSKTDDFDPSEVSAVVGEFGQLPGTRSYGFNLKIGF